MALYKILLFPMSILYDAATRLRNHFYNIGSKPVIHFETVTISVGNLAVGGTGKTPMVEYLIRLLKDRYKVATLSRGYGRKTKGFKIASEHSTATSIGDEPMQFYRKFNTDIIVAVGEERAIAIPEILFHHPAVEVILLDDAYQHRKVERDLNILLTAFDTPFFKDHVLPAGRLREARKGAQRADAVVVTKCPATLSELDKKSYIKAILEYSRPDVPIFFSGIRYEHPQPVYDTAKAPAGKVVLISGLANAGHFENFAKKKYEVVKHMAFGDHHQYTIKDVQHIKEEFKHIEGDFLLTTEKDMVKLLKPDIQAILGDLPIYYMPIQTYILDQEDAFKEMVLNSITKRKDSLQGII